MAPVRTDLRLYLLLAVSVALLAVIAWLVWGPPSGARDTPSGDRPVESGPVPVAALGAAPPDRLSNGGERSAAEVDDDSSNGDSEDEGAPGDGPAVVRLRVVAGKPARPRPGVRVLLSLYRLSDRWERRRLTHAERQPTVRTTDGDGRVEFVLPMEPESEMRGSVFFVAPGEEKDPIPIYSLEAGQHVDFGDVTLRPSSPTNTKRVAEPPKGASPVEMIRWLRQRSRQVRR